MSGIPTPSPANSPTGPGSGPSGSTGSGSSGGGSPDCPCPHCGQHHPGLEHGQEMPNGTRLRRGIRNKGLNGDKTMKPNVLLDRKMSCDMASMRSAQQTKAITKSLADTDPKKIVATVEFTAEQAVDAFQDNKVIFKCSRNNPWHCQVEGRKTQDQCEKFAKALNSEVKF